MIRLGALFWLLLVVTAGFVTFKVKYAVQDIEDGLNRVRKQTVAEQQEIRVLTAEWTYLNQPERLAEMNRRFLQLTPIAAKQLQQKIEDIPFRPLPPPDVVPEFPDIVVAANTDRTQPQPAGATAEATATLSAALPSLASLAISQAVASELPVAAAPLKPAPIKSAAPVRLAKAGPAKPARSLDELFSQVAEMR